ncbi:MAG: redoxin domain-containing protein, partial [Desulfuromonadaceae bacterium]
EDAADRMPAKIRQLDIDFPYLVDASQKVARAFQAQCTPDSYLFDARGGLVYHGRIDDNWKDEKRVRREELKVAMDGLAAGKPTLKRQWPSLGCSIKWRQQE